MKAGTARRVAPTLLSSLVMIRQAGPKGLMVDVCPRTGSLRGAAKRLGQLTGYGREHVRDALRQAG